jgi:hypothetical protein
MLYYGLSSVFHIVWVVSSRANYMFVSSFWQKLVSSLLSGLLWRLMMVPFCSTFTEFTSILIRKVILSSIHIAKTFIEIKIYWHRQDFVFRFFDQATLPLNCWDVLDSVLQTSTISVSGFAKVTADYAHEKQRKMKTWKGKFCPSLYALLKLFNLFLVLIL